MDHFGIGQAISSMVSMYFISSRSTGRTISMLDSVKDGDRIIFADARESERVKRLLMERELDVECITIDPRYPERLFDKGTSQGRTIFDHTWVEEYYTHCIQHIRGDIDHFQEQLSGYGEKHRETKRRAQELAKWRF